MLLPDLFHRVQNDPFRAFDQMQREFDSLFRATGATGYGQDVPAMNIWRSEEGLALTAELPGVRPEDLELTVHEDVLKLKGKRPLRELAEGETILRQERDHGEFERTFKLPIRIATDQVKATFDNGLLRVELPRVEEDRPRRVQIKVS